MNESEPITEAWLLHVGFAWQQHPRQPGGYVLQYTDLHGDELDPGEHFLRLIPLGHVAGYLVREGFLLAEDGVAAQAEETCVFAAEFKNGTGSWSDGVGFPKDFATRGDVVDLVNAIGMELRST